MDTRRLPFLLLLVLLPVPAQADRHFTECFLGLSPEKRQAVAARVSCGFRLYEFVDTTAGTTGDTTGTGGTPGTGAGPATGATKVMKSAFFLFAEGAEYIAGIDSGRTVDAWMIGLRFSMLAQSSVEPFVHAMGGRQYSSGPGATAGDAAATGAPPPRVSSAVGAVGGGVEIKVTRFKPGERSLALVPVIRLQVDLVETGASGFHPYGRATFGVSFRFEGHAHR